jgi:hypothetical protein
MSKIKLGCRVPTCEDCEFFRLLKDSRSKGFCLKNSKNNLKNKSNFISKNTEICHNNYEKKSFAGLKIQW